MLYNLIEDHGKILLRSEIISKRFKFYNPNNTTEYLGLKTLFLTCSQLINIIEIYSQDISNSNFDKTNSYDITKFKTIEENLDSNLQELLAEPSQRNIVKDTINLGFSQAKGSYIIPRIFP